MRSLAWTGLGAAGAQVGAPGPIARARRLRELLAVLVGPFEPAEVRALARADAGDEEAHPGRLLRPHDRTHTIAIGIANLYAHAYFIECLLIGSLAIRATPVKRAR